MKWLELGFDLAFHAIAFAFDQDRLSVMEEAIEDGSGQGGIVGSIRRACHLDNSHRPEGGYPEGVPGIAAEFWSCPALFWVCQHFLRYYHSFDGIMPMTLNPAAGC